MHSLGPNQCSLILPISSETQWLQPACYCNLGASCLQSAQKSWGGLDIRPPQCFIHTMSFNQDQSSAKEHMGPTDTALIPLGFCLRAGCTAPLVPRLGAVRSATNTSNPPPTIRLITVGWGRNACRGNGGLFIQYFVWSPVKKWNETRLKNVFYLQTIINKSVYYCCDWLKVFPAKFCRCLN